MEQYVFIYYSFCLANWNSVRTALLALIAFFPTSGDGALASLDWSQEERRKLAKKSLSFKCKKCGACAMTALPDEDETEVIEDLPDGMSIRDSKKVEKPSKEESDPGEINQRNSQVVEETRDNGFENESNNNDQDLRNDNVPRDNVDRPNANVNNSNVNERWNNSFAKKALDCFMVLLILIFIVLLKKIISSDYSVESHFPA